MVALDILLRPVLLPILLWQAIGVRRAALSLPEAAGAREGVCGTGESLRLLIVGDSSAAGVGVAQQAEALSGQTVQRLEHRFQINWRLIAKTGATAQTTLDALAQDRTERVDQFDVAVLVLGVNDAVRLRSKRVWLARHKALRHVLIQHYGVRHIIVPAVPPLDKFPALTPLMRWMLGAHAKRLDRALSDRIAQEHNAYYIAFDLPLTPQAMASDGYHPNAQSYALFGERIASRIAALWQTEIGDS